MRGEGDGEILKQRGEVTLYSWKMRFRGGDWLIF